MYINDLPNNIHSTVHLFADDCVLYREINNQLDSQQLQIDLDELTKWEHDWHMHFNPDKCFVMRLTHARDVKQFNYTLGHTTLCTGNRQSRQPRALGRIKLLPVTNV